MKNYIFASLSLIAFSCSTVLDIDVPRRPPKITINAFFTSDSLWSSLITVDAYILDNQYNFVAISDAAVMIYQDNKPVDTLRYQNGTSYYNRYVVNYKSRSRKPMNNKPYEIRVTSPTYGASQATAALPYSTNINLVEADFAASTPTIAISFKDRPEEQNYYYTYMTQKYAYYDYFLKDTVRSRIYLSLETKDPAFQTNHGNHNGLLFDDGLFNGKNISIEFLANYFQPVKDDTIDVHLLTVSKELYDYLVTYDVQDAANSDPLSQPALVYSNIENGVGIFAGYGETVYKFTYQ